MKLFFLSVFTTFFLGTTFSLFANITSVEEIELNERSRSYVGIVENPYETMNLTDVILKLSCFHQDHLVNEVVFPLEKDVSPLGSEPFEVISAVNYEKPCDRYIVEYASYDTLEVDLLPMLNSNPPAFVRSDSETNSDIYAIEVTNAGSSKSQNPGITLLIFDDRGAVIFFTQSSFKGIILPNRSHEFLLRVPIDIPLMTSRFKISTQDKASPILAKRGTIEREDSLPSYTLSLLE